MLRSQIPMFLVWGNEKSFFYNDAFELFLDPEIQGITIGETIENALPSEWSEVVDTVTKIIRGETQKSENNITAFRNKKSSKKNTVYLTASYTTVYGLNGNIEAVLGTCIENSSVIPNLIDSRSARSQLNSVMMHSSAGIAQADINGRVMEVNERYCQMLKYSRQEILEMNLGQLTHPDDLENNMRLLQKCIEEGKDFRITKRYVCGDKSVIWVNNSISIVNDPDGKKYITAVAVDITDEIENEKKLRASESRFRNLIASAPVGTALYYGSDFHIELANDVMLEYWKTDQNIVGKKIIDALPVEAAGVFIGLLKEVYESGREHKIAAAQIWKLDMQEDRYFDYTLTPLFDDKGNVYGILNMCSDVTDNVLTQRELSESRSELASIFEQSPVGIATISNDERLVYQSANSFYCELVGRTSEELIGKSLLEALPELKGQGFDDLLKEVIQSEKAYTANEVEVKLLRGGNLEYIYVNLTYQINRNISGEALGLLVIATDVTRQVVSRREVEDSEMKLRNLIAAAPAGIGLFVGRDLIIEYPNKTFIDIVGKGPHIDGLPLREAMPELITEGQAYLKILDDVFTTGIPFISSASLVKIVQDGVLNDNYYNISYTPLRNRSGEIYAILDIAIDVTAQVNAQKAMQESEAHLQLLRDTVPAMIFYLDKDQRYQSYNTVFMDWFSVGESEAIGLSVREFIGEAAYAKTLPNLKIAYSGKQVKYEMFAPSRMGVERWLNIVYTPHINNEGDVIGVIVHATDITQSKKTEIALRDSEANFRSAVELAQLGIWSMDIKTGITTLSVRHAEMFGFTKTLMSSEEARSVIIDADKERVAKAFFDAQQLGNDGKYEAEYMIINAETGREKIIHSIGQTYFDAAGTPSVISGTAQDITIQRKLQLTLESEVNFRTRELDAALRDLRELNYELERSNQALKHSNQELAQFAYVASHDLQEPLRKIQIFAGLLKEGKSSLDKETIINKIDFSASRMSLLISDLLAFSRLINPKKSFNLVDLNKIVAAVWNDFELAAEEKNAVITTDNLPVIMAAGLQMNQLFYNLISNSLKFTSPERTPRISIKTELVSRDYVAAHTNSNLEAARYHYIIFTDNGIGFEKHYGRQIFEIFNRLHQQSIYPGSGIGLALCRRIVMNHHGVIFADGEPDTGAAFHIFLPEVPVN
ncbi:hypothetical protein GCM10022423_00360 [Flavobacterium ginsengiterrae]|uniref:histidine kinase n=2 Tax=Flavobacterium ginsengiterrae TaxID=871695 RepID=A0ABP7G388_9FLAO